MGAAVTFRFAHHLANDVKLSFVCGQGLTEVKVRLLLGAKLATATSRARKIDHQRSLRNDSHFQRSGADQIDDRCLAGDQATGGQGNGARYTIDASDGDMCAMW